MAAHATLSQSYGGRLCESIYLKLKGRQTAGWWLPGGGWGRGEQIWGTSGSALTWMGPAWHRTHQVQTREPHRCPATPGRTKGWREALRCGVSTDWPHGML